MAVGFVFLVLHKESDFFKSFLLVLPGTSGRSSRYLPREHKIPCYTAQYTKVYEIIIQMAVGFVFLVLHKESNFLKSFFKSITRNKRALLPTLVAGT